MPKNNPSLKGLMDSIVPISRFNRGEASKIFEEVNDKGVKLVLKNNVPVCILMKPERYEELVEALEDYALYFEAERRMKHSNPSEMVSSQIVMEQFGISEDELEGIKVEIE